MPRSYKGQQVFRRPHYHQSTQGSPELTRETSSKHGRSLTLIGRFGLSRITSDTRRWYSCILILPQSLLRVIPTTLNAPWPRLGPTQLVVLTAPVSFLRLKIMYLCPQSPLISPCKSWPPCQVWRSSGNLTWAQQDLHSWGNFGLDPPPVRYRHFLTTWHISSDSLQPYIPHPWFQNRFEPS